MDKINIMKYKKIEKFLSEDEIKIYAAYAKDKHRNNSTNFDLTQTTTGDSFFYKDPLFQFLLNDKKHVVESNTNLKLHSTYSFWRCYTYDSELKKHTDRPSCEISVTVNIDSDKTEWPIFIGGDSITLNPGDGVIYKGCDVEHWREVFKGDYQIQAFLHYVNANGPFKEFKGDTKD